VTTIIFEISLRLKAWLIPHLIANSSTSELMIWTVWCGVLIRGLLCTCICDMNITISFLILESVITRAHEGLLEDLIVILSSCWMCNFVKNKSSGLNLFFFSFLFSFFFWFSFPFSIFRTRVRVRVTRLHCYIPVTLDNMVTSYMMHGRT